MDKKDITIDDREQTKRICYAILYGVGKEKLAEDLTISIEKATAIIKNFSGISTTCK